MLNKDFSLWCVCGHHESMWFGRSNCCCNERITSVDWTQTSRFRTNILFGIPYCSQYTTMSSACEYRQHESYISRNSHILNPCLTSTFA